jgi:hypothetical protein
MLRPPRAPSLSHSHSRTRTHARGACPVCLCVLLLPPQKNCTALLIAASNGHKDVAELLLERNADVNSVNGPVSADGCARGGVGWGKVVVFYFRVLVNVCVCVSSVRVLWGGGTVIVLFLCVG